MTTKRKTFVKTNEKTATKLNIGMSKLFEDDLERAELVLAAKDVLNNLQDMAEKIAKMGAEDIMPLVSNMQGVFGTDKARRFEDAATHSLDGALDAVKQAKDSLNVSILELEGKVEPGMNDDMAKHDDHMDMKQHDDMPHADHKEKSPNIDDFFGGAESASGPEDEPLGRAKKESYDIVRAGHFLLEKQSLKSLVNWALKEAAENLPQEKFAGVAANIAMKAASEPLKLAGWIGAKKYGHGAMAQLCNPITNTTASALPEKLAGKVTEAALVDHVAKLIKSNVRKTGTGKAAKVLEFVVRKNQKVLAEGVNQVSVAKQFINKYGCSPAEYSVRFSKFAKLHEDDAAMQPMSSADKQKASGVMSNIAQRLTTDKTLGNKPVQAVMNTIQGTDRTTMQKMLNNMNQSGQSPTNVQDFVAKAKDMVDPNATASAQTAANSGGTAQSSSTVTSTGSQGPNSVQENINAAHWPVDTAGQYKDTKMKKDSKPEATDKPMGEKSSIKMADKMRPEELMSTNKTAKEPKPTTSPSVESPFTDVEYPKDKVEENWDTEMHTAKKDKGMWDGWTKAELEAERNRLKEKAKHTAAETKRLKQIDFALRAKSGWGKVNENETIARMLSEPTRELEMNLHRLRDKGTHRTAVDDEIIKKIEQVLAKRRAQGKE